MRFIKIILAFVATLVLFGCSSGKSNDVLSQPQKPFTPDDIAQANGASSVNWGTKYLTADGGISFINAYRCKLLTGGSKEYKNAVVLEVSADSLESAQKALQNTSRGRLLNLNNAVYQIPVGYTLVRDPVTSQLYVVYPTQASEFAPDFQYLIIGDFAPEGTLQYAPLMFDTGDLLDEADITPFRPQQLPAGLTIEDINIAFLDALDKPDFDAQIMIDEQKMKVLANAPYRGSESAALNDGRDLYAAARRALGIHGLHIDSYDLTFLDQAGAPVYKISNLDFWKKPEVFYYESCTNENEVKQIDILSGASASASATITLAEYNKINLGDTLSHVKTIIGGPGERLSSIEIAGIKTEMYAWYGEDGYSNATLLFQGDKVTTMSQFGLS